MIAELRQLVDLFKAGRFAELEVRSRDLTEHNPQLGAGWQMLGLSLARQGKDALAALEAAARCLPDDAGAQHNLGNALARLGRLEEAADRFRRALSLDPALAEAHVNLGRALMERGDIDAAAASCRRAVELEPGLADAHATLGDALLRQGSAADAVQSYGRALALEPLCVGTHNNLGLAWQKLDRPQDALASFSRALRIDADFAQAHINCGNVLLELGGLDEALASYRRALEIDPASAQGHNNLGNALRALGRLADAVASYQRALQLQPAFAAAHCNLGRALRLQGRTADAQAWCRKASAIDPGMAAPHVVMADCCADEGRFAEAERLFERAIELEPAAADAWAGLARVRPARDGARWLARLQRAASPPLPARMELHLRYALGKSFDDLGDYEQAFANYARANELTKLGRAPHDRRQLARAVDLVIGNHDRRWTRQSRPDAPASNRPVFIVGMLRSGTTLAEQILASHPAVHGGGELPFWSTAAAAHGPSAMTAGASPGLLRRLAGDYLQLLDAVSKDARRVVDKMPTNFPYLGLILAALPNARIIHLRRDPRDTCLSIYFQHFEATASYACDLEDLAHYYREYSRMMEHWRATLPEGAMLEVPYEALVNGQEEWSRRMVAHLGLDWDPRCLEFHRTQRNVITASKWQVRQPMTASSVGRWRHYEKFLGPLRDLRG